MPRRRLNFDFWNRHPTEVACDLIGCVLSMRQHDGVRCEGRIVETEAYHHSEEACHAYPFRNRKRSERVAHFFGPAGFSYVYLNYGIHKLLNVITGPEEDGSAVLIRAIEPCKGLEQMQRNRNVSVIENLSNGPGKLTQALGINLDHNKTNVSERNSPVAFYGRPSTATFEVQRGPRVGISKARRLKWRFAASGSAFLSKAKENKFLEKM